MKYDNHSCIHNQRSHFLDFSLLSFLDNLLGKHIDLLPQVIIIFEENYASKMTKNDKALSLLSVLGSGGHTTEMLALVESLDHDKYRRTFVHANTDSMSAKKLAMLPSQTNIQVIIFEIFYYILVFLCQLFLHFRFVRFPELAKLVKVGFHH